MFVGSIFAATFVFDVVFDDAINTWWERRNQGKLWKDVKLQIAANGDADDE